MCVANGKATGVRMTKPLRTQMVPMVRSKFWALVIVIFALLVWGMTLLQSFLTPLAPQNGTVYSVPLGIGRMLMFCFLRAHS